jgi:peptidoglycan lytic transglycosylase
LARAKILLQKRRRDNRAAGIAGTTSMSRRACVAIALAFPALVAPAAHAGKVLSGAAAYYSEDYKGLTASGARYNPKKFTCAHRTLPFGTRLRVTARKTHRSVLVVVNDRGPFDRGRMLDLSLAAAKALHMTRRGVIQVTATVQRRHHRKSASAVR